MKNHIKSFITQTVQFIIIFVLFHNSTNEPWFQNKLRDTLVLLTSYVIFMIVPLLGWIFRPMDINVKQENKLGKGAGNTQILLERNELKTPQSQRTINLTVEITRKGSIWWRILMWRLKNVKVNITINSSPNNLFIQGTDFLQLNEIEITSNGFSIDLNEFATELNLKNGTFTISKSYPYFIADHPDNHIPHNLSAVIQPCLTTNGKKSRITNLLIRFRSENHQVIVFRR